MTQFRVPIDIQVQLSTEKLSKFIFHFLAKFQNSHLIAAEPEQKNFFWKKTSVFWKFGEFFSDESSFTQLFSDEMKRVDQSVAFSETIHQKREKKLGRPFCRILSWSNWPRDKFDSLKIGFELDYGAMDSALACNANGPGSISMTSKCFFFPLGY